MASKRTAVSTFFSQPSAFAVPASRPVVPGAGVRVVSQGDHSLVVGAQARVVAIDAEGFARLDVAGAVAFVPVTCLAFDTTADIKTVTEAQKRTVACPECGCGKGQACRSSRIPGSNTFGGGWGGPPDLERAHGARRAAFLTGVAMIRESAVQAVAK